MIFTDDSSHNVSTSTTKPYCMGCWREVTLINGSFMCDHIGCSELGVPKKATEVAWY